MSSTYAPRGDQHSSRGWWSMKSSNSKDLAEKTSSKKSLTTFVSGISLKSKKHPSLTIQEPPMTLISPPTSPVSLAIRPRSRPSPTIQTRPLSNSISSTRSRGDSIGPRTPVDTLRSSPHQSLLTLSDVDPFAARAISSPSSLDPNRLSAYSNTSVPDYASKANENSRSSYASSSMYSSGALGDVSPRSSQFVSEPSSPRQLTPRKSMGSLRHPSMVDSLASALEVMNHNPASMLIHADKNRFSQPELPPTKPRPPMRARGMTDSGARKPPQFYRTESAPPAASPSASTSTSPRVLVRQPSLARIGLPPSAPPAQDLPPPPPPVPSPSFRSQAEDLIPAVPRLSSTSQSPVFITSLALNRDLSISTTYKPSDSSLPPDSFFLDRPVTRGIKKAASQQSLSSQQFTPPSSEPLVEKTVRKQRSFHQTRIPLPNIPPLRHSNSTNEPTPTPDSKRGSTSGPPTPGRKRLFSASSMRRTSSSHDDDTRSIFSLRSEGHTHAPKLAPPPVTVPAPQPPSFWDECVSTPKTVLDYTPQKIMSPADMLKLEEKLEEETDRTQRKRGMSAASNATFASATSSFSVLSGPPIEGMVPLSPSRITSLVVKIPPTSPTRRNNRPSSSHSNSMMSPESDWGDGGMMSLSPPPRKWSRPLTADPPSPSGLISLPPPPRSRKRTLEKAVDHSARRQSLMRKPSFLNISDDEAADLVPSNNIVQGSFIDFRESFDTERSHDD